MTFPLSLIVVFGSAMLMIGGGYAWHCFLRWAFPQEEDESQVILSIVCAFAVVLLVGAAWAIHVNYPPPPPPAEHR